MKKLVTLASALLIGCISLFANGEEDFSKGQCCIFSEEYKERVTYQDAKEYLNFYYPNMSEELKENISLDAANFSLNPNMDRNEALANCIEMIIVFYS